MAKNSFSDSFARTSRRCSTLSSFRGNGERGGQTKAACGLRLTTSACALSCSMHTQNICGSASIRWTDNRQGSQLQWLVSVPTTSVLLSEFGCGGGRGIPLAWTTLPSISTALGRISERTALHKPEESRPEHRRAFSPGQPQSFDTRLRYASN